MHIQQIFRQGRATASRRQRGAVLIVSLVLLVILTLLGVSMMNTTKLEERMAANIQEATQAFQSAETGLSQGFNDAAAWNTNAAITQVATTIPGSTRKETSEFVTSFIATTGPPSGYDVAQFQTAHFDFQSTGQRCTDPPACTNPVYVTTLHGGGFQVFRKTGVTE